MKCSPGQLIRQIPFDDVIDDLLDEYEDYINRKYEEDSMKKKLMKIMVTGSHGFVGNATKKYVDKIADVEWIDYDLMNKRDVRDRDQVEWVMREYSPDKVLHLAAIARFAEADNDPLLAHETNVIGTINVVDACKKYHIPLVHASTGSAIMPLNAYEPPYTEEIPARGNSVYGTTKAIAECYVRKLTPHIVLRYAHLYGAEKRFHGLIGGFLSRIERGLAPELYGGKQTNSFVYIEDVARANWIALTAAPDKWNQIYNIGSTEELSAADAGKVVCDVFGYKGEIDIKEQRTVDASRFQFDISKSKRMLGWEPQYTFEQGIRAMKKVMG